MDRAPASTPAAEHDSTAGATASTAAAEERTPTDSTDLEPDLALKRIRKAASECFERTGYAETSIRQIAAAAGVSKSLVHYHFQSKEQLFAEVYMRRCNRLAARVRAAVAAHGGSAVERSLVGLDTLFAETREGMNLMTQAALTAHALASPNVGQHIRRLQAELRELLIETIRAIHGPDVPLPLSVETVADMLLAALAGIGLHAVIDESHERLNSSLAGIRVLVEIALHYVEKGAVER